MKKKILLICFSLIVFTTLTVGTIFHKMMKDNYIQSIFSTAVSNTKLIHILLEENLYADKYLFKLSQSFSQKTGFRITFIREDGIPIADSTDNSILFENFSTIPSFQNAIKSITSYRLKKDTPSKIPVIQVFIKSKFYNKKSVIIMLSKELTLFEEFQKQTIFIILSGILFSTMLSFLISIYFTNRAIKPIIQLTHLAKDIAKGDFDTKISIHSHDELEELAVSFSHMKDRIKTLLKDIENRAHNLQTILDNLAEGILVLDPSGSIVLINQFAKKQFAIPDTEKDFFSLPGFDFFQKEVNLSLINKKNFQIKRKIKKNIFLIHNHFIKDNNQMIIVLQDITKAETNEELRREFVSNASHELKTPLTILSGFIETIKLGHVQDSVKFHRILDIMENETQRLNSLVNSLLQLSNLENNPVESEKKSYSFLPLVDTFNNILVLYENILEKENISLEVDVEDCSLHSPLTEEWLRIVVGNLLENAIKYSPANSKIILKAKIESFSFLVSVQDFGCGIPQKDQKKIFQRFFRVDPSRNSKIKGSGLGLAIVKKMVEKEKGKIKLESDLGKGSTFYITIPLEKKR